MTCEFNFLLLLHFDKSNIALLNVRKNGPFILDDASSAGACGIVRRRLRLLVAVRYPDRGAYEVGITYCSKVETLTNLLINLANQAQVVANLSFRQWVWVDY